MKGLTKDQVHRLLEDIQTIAMTAKLLLQVIDNLGNDIRGMLSANNKKSESKTESLS